ncbi:hypothetical protein AMELA_G00119750, partial [Ameiurus melas]
RNAQCPVGGVWLDHVTQRPLIWLTRCVYLKCFVWNAAVAGSVRMSSRDVCTHKKKKKDSETAGQRSLTRRRNVRHFVFFFNLVLDSELSCSLLSCSETRDPSSGLGIKFDKFACDGKKNLEFFYR